MVPWLKKHRRKLVAMLVAVVPLAMIIGSAGAKVGQDTSGASQLGGSMLGAVQAMASGAVSSIAGGWSRLVGGELREENERLRREVDRLREENTRLIGVLQENARLREMVGFQTDRPGFELAPARVVGRDITPYFRVEKIRIDSRQDLQPRMPVVAPQGIVGQIHRVYDRYADVVLLADPRSSIDVISQRNRALGVVKGLGDDTNYRAEMAYVEQRDELREGDTLVTSGMGGVFPRELPVGSVVEVEYDDEELFQEVVVEPAVDFSRLEEVFVITDHD